MRRAFTLCRTLAVPEVDLAQPTPSSKKEGNAGHFREAAICRNRLANLVTTVSSGFFELSAGEAKGS